MMQNSQEKTKGWPPKRRAEYARRIRKHKIWTKSTGPKTPKGKARSCQNARKHGAHTLIWRILRAVLRIQRSFLNYINKIIKTRSLQNTPIDPYDYPVPDPDTKYELPVLKRLRRIIF